MKRILFALALSILFHIVAFAAIATVQLLSPPPKKQVKIMYIKHIELPKTKIKELKKIEVNKVQPKNTHIEPKDAIQPKTVSKIAINKKKKISKPTKSPKPVIQKISKPIKEPKTKKLTSYEVKEQENQKKITVLRKHPYFKNWSDARIKRLELPPGINSWDEAKKLTEFFDTQYQWVYTPPALGDGKDKTKDPDINPYESNEQKTLDEITPEWKEYQEVNNEYSIRFYKDNIGFIAYFKEEDKKVEVSYFPFTPNIDNKEIEIKIPDSITPEDIKNFTLPLTKEDLEARKNTEQDKLLKEQLIRDIVRTYKQQKLN